MIIIEEKIRDLYLGKGNVKVEELIDEILEEDYSAFGIPIHESFKRYYDYYGEVYKVIIKEDCLIINNKKFSRS